MRLKSFHGPTIADAMRQARQALGDDAIIVATREDDMGGVRVTAALDDAPAMPSAKPAAESQDIIEPITDALYRHGVHAALAEKLISSAINFAEEDAVIALAAGFDAHMKFRPLDDVPARPLVLVGPPGAGKTLAIAKLATEAKMKKRPVTVITTDLSRAGGIEQLAAFTNLLKVRLLEIEEPQAVRDTMIELSAGSTVLIDTAGRNPYDESERHEFLQMIGDAVCDIALVLPCGYDSEDGTALAKAFRSLGAARLLLTRGDVARRLGTMLNIAHESGLPLANISRSPKVAEPLAPLNPIIVAQTLLTPLQRDETARPLLPQTGTHA
ncbi:MAG: GTPase [Alphaproteobacteria bacterium]